MLYLVAVHSTVNIRFKEVSMEFKKALIRLKKNMREIGKHCKWQFGTFLKMRKLVASSATGKGLEDDHARQPSG